MTGRVPFGLAFALSVALATSSTLGGPDWLRWSLGAAAIACIAGWLHAQMYARPLRAISHMGQPADPCAITQRVRVRSLAEYDAELRAARARHAH